MARDLLADIQHRHYLGQPSQVSIAIYRSLSKYAEVRDLRMARRTTRQFYEGQVITSEAWLAVIFGRRVVVASPHVSYFLFPVAWSVSVRSQKGSRVLLQGGSAIAGYAIGRNSRDPLDVDVTLGSAGGGCTQFDSHVP